MTGLRNWVRDSELPARSGQAELSPPAVEEVADLLTAHVLVPDAAPPTEITWDYARWKPGISITCTYRLRWSDGHEETLVSKRYTGDKVRHLAERKDNSAELQSLSPRLRPRVILPDQSLSLWCPAADRELPGVAFLLNVKRFASLVKKSGITEPGLIRRRKSEYEPLRYKAERRAVFRARLKLRDTARTRINLAARVLPLEEALRISTARRNLESVFDAAGETPFVPRLLGFHERYGILIEEWWDVKKGYESDDFSHARAAGVALANLHALALPGETGEASSGSGQDLRPLFSIDAALNDRYRGLHDPKPRSKTWIHGDFHPDQIVLIERQGRHSTALLDLDRLGPGDPTTDVANWIADHLFEDEELSFEEAASPLLEGYTEGGGTIVDDHLKRRVADDLIRRGAATIRRLEKGAVGRAARCLERAQAII